MEITTEMALLAVEIADQSAPMLLESNCIPVNFNGDVWYDLELLSEEEKSQMGAELSYCELRGLMRKHPEKSNLFQTLEP